MRLSRFGNKLSPNGKWLPYCFDENGVTNLSVAAFPAVAINHRRRLPGNLEHRCTRFFFVSGNKVYAMPVRDPNNFEPVPPQELFHRWWNDARRKTLPRISCHGRNSWLRSQRDG